MSAIDEMLRIASGRRSPALLHTCRLQVAGAEFYGEEAILERFRESPIDVSAAEAVLGTGNAALFGKDAALFADLHDGRISRLWWTAAIEAAPVEPAMPVAFDPDLAQARGDVFMRAQDHPELDPASAARIAAAGRELVESGQGLRIRAFVVRAFTVGDVSAALFAVYGLEEGRQPRFGFRAVKVGVR